MDTVSEAIEAVRADNLTSLRLSAFSYSRVMPILTVWHGRAVLEGRLRRSKRRLPGIGTHHGRSARHMGARPNNWSQHGSSASVTR